LSKPFNINSAHRGVQSDNNLAKFMTQNVNNQVGSLLSRAHDDKPLFPISIKFHESLILQDLVYKDDTPITICDRLSSKYP